MGARSSPRSRRTASPGRERWCRACGPWACPERMSLLDRAVSLVLPAVPKPIVRHFSRRYIAGSTMEDALRVTRELAARGAMATLDILGEFITTPEEAALNTQ